MDALENELINEPKPQAMVSIDYNLYQRLKELGIIQDGIDDTRCYNVGTSDYSKHLIQPWSIWLEYSLDPFDADIIKRVLRTKKGDSKLNDYEKIIHICKEKIRQIKSIIRDKNDG